MSCHMNDNILLRLTVVRPTFVKLDSNFFSLAFVHFLMKKITEVCRLHNISKRCTFLSTSAEIQMSKKQDKSKNVRKSCKVIDVPIVDM